METNEVSAPNIVDEIVNRKDGSEAYDFFADFSDHWPEPGLAATVEDNRANRNLLLRANSSTVRTLAASRRTGRANAAGDGLRDAARGCRGALTRGPQGATRKNAPGRATRPGGHVRTGSDVHERVRGGGRACGDRPGRGLCAAAIAAAAASGDHQRSARPTAGRYVYQSGANPRGVTCHTLAAIGMVFDGHLFNQRQAASMGGTIFGQVVASSNKTLDPRITDGVIQALNLNERLQHDLGDVLNRLSPAVEDAAGIRRQGEGVEQTRENARNTMSGWHIGTQMRTVAARYCANPSCEAGWTPSVESALLLTLHDPRTGKVRQPLTLGSLLSDAYEAHAVNGSCPREGCAGRQVTQRFHAMGEGRIVAAINRRQHDRYFDNKVVITQTVQATDVTGATWKYRLQNLVLWHPAGQVSTCMDASTWSSRVPGNGNRGGHYTILIRQSNGRWVHYNDGRRETLTFKEVRHSGRRVAAATWLRISRVNNGTADLHEAETEVLVYGAGVPDKLLHMNAASVLDRHSTGRHTDTDVIGFADDKDNGRLTAAEWCDRLSRNNAPTDAVRHHRRLYIVSRLANRPAAPWQGIDSAFARLARGDTADDGPANDKRRDATGDAGGGEDGTRDSGTGDGEDAAGTEDGDSGLGLPTMEEIAANTLHSGGWPKGFSSIPSKLMHEVVKRMTALLGSLAATGQQSDLVRLTLLPVCLQRFQPSGAGKRKAAQNKLKLDAHVAMCCDAYQGESKAATNPAIMALYHKLWPVEQRETRKARARKQNARKAGMPDSLQAEDMKLSLQMALSGEYNKAMRALRGARPAKWGDQTTVKMRAKHGQADAASDALLHNVSDALAEKLRQIRTDAGAANDAPMTPADVASALASLNVVKKPELARRRAEDDAAFDSLNVVTRPNRRTSQTAREKKKGARTKENAKKRGSRRAHKKVVEQRREERATEAAERATEAAAAMLADLRVDKNTRMPGRHCPHRMREELNLRAGVNRLRRAAEAVKDGPRIMRAAKRARRRRTRRARRELAADRNDSPVPSLTGGPDTLEHTTRRTTQHTEASAEEHTLQECRAALAAMLSAKDFDLNASVHEAMFSFSDKTSPGPLSLPPRLWKDMLLADSGSGQLLDSLTALVRTMLLGSFGDNGSALAMCSLFGIAKKDGGVRPIACGMLLRRLAGKVACQLGRADFNELMGEHQYGLAKMGAPRLVHMAADLHARRKDDPDFVMVLLDFSNAFNSVSRKAFRGIVRRVCPWLSPFVELLYSGDSDLLFADTIIRSVTGTQQGDPLGPALFSLVLHYAVLEIERRFPGLELNKWFLDDGTVAGPRAVIAGVLDYLRSSEVEDLGLLLNCAVGKTTAIYAHADEAVADAHPVPLAQQLQLPEKNIVRHENGNFQLLGAPIGDDAHIAQFVDNVAAKHGQLLERATRAFDVYHHRAVVTRYTTGYCKLVYFMRCAPPSAACGAALAKFQLQLRELWASMGIGANNEEWKQLELPVHLGGAALTNAEHRHHAAFYASYTAAVELDGWTPNEQMLQRVRSAINLAVRPDAACFVVSESDRDTMNIATGGWVDLASGQATCSQAYLSRWLTYSEIACLSAASARTADRLCRLADPYAGAFLNAVPSMDGCLCNDGFVITNQQRLGRDVYTHAGHLCPVCVTRQATLNKSDARTGKKSAPRHPGYVDAGGAHSLKCGYGGDRQARHTRLVRGIGKLATGAGKSTSYEQNVTPGVDKNYRAGDLVIRGGARNGKDLVIDVGIVFGGQFDPNTQATTCNATAAADQYATTKNKRYKSDVEANGDMEFAPITVSHFGVWSVSALATLKHIARLATANIADPQRASRARYHIFTRLSVEIQKENALTVMRRRSHLERAARIQAMRTVAAA